MFKKILLLFIVIVGVFMVKVEPLNADIYIQKNEQHTQQPQKVEVYYDILLQKELQDYIKQLCQKYEVNTEIILAIMKTESEFKHEISSLNQSEGGRSVGISQLNENYIDWYCKLTGINNFDITNIKNNIEGGVAVFKYYYDYWKQRGYVGKELEIYALNSYNMGVQGYQNYLKRYGNISRSYDQKVFRNMEEIKCSKVMITED